MTTAPASARSTSETSGEGSVSITDPYVLGRLGVRNRIWIPPMCQYSVEARDGVPTPWHLAHLGSFAAGGAGLIIAEATAVVPEGRITAWDTGLWNDAQRDAWGPIVDFAHAQGALIGVQLAHAGRKASTYRPWQHRRDTMPVDEGGWQTVAPSAVAFPGYAEPRELTADEIAGIPDLFAAAAVRAREADFDLVELHAAHGYLLHQFLSSLSNTRTDEWGGDLAGRAHLLMATARAVIAAVGDDLEVLVRMSATDWIEGGWDEEQTAIVAGWLAAEGVHLIDVSSGGNAPAKIEVGPGYQVPLAQTVRELGGIPTGAVGLITDPFQADAIVAEGRADAVFIGREALRDPHFANRAAAALGHEGWLPPQYQRAPFAEPAPRGIPASA